MRDRTIPKAAWTIMTHFSMTPPTVMFDTVRKVNTVFLQHLEMTPATIMAKLVTTILLMGPLERNSVPVQPLPPKTAPATMILKAQPPKTGRQGI